MNKLNCEESFLQLQKDAKHSKLTEKDFVLLSVRQLMATIVEGIPQQSKWGKTAWDLRTICSFAVDTKQMEAVDFINYFLNKYEYEEHNEYTDPDSEK